jgi:alginate O-acetyltransferase complex protein AlgJ
MRRSSISAFKLWKLSLLPRSLSSAHWAGAGRLRNVALAVVFLIALAVPMVGGLRGRPGVISSENRVAHPHPGPFKRSLPYTQSFDKYYADRTGGRKSLLRLRNDALASLFDESPVENVIVGRDGWLYLNFGYDPYRSSGVAATKIDRVASVVRDRAAWCQERGITYVAMIVPDKHRVHPEHLPERLAKWPDNGHLSEFAKLSHGVTVIDLQPVLRNAVMAGEEVYYPTDTHWNTRGIQLAYWELGKVLSRQHPEYVPLRADQFHAHVHAIRHDDLAAMLDRPMGPVETVVHYPIERSPVMTHPTDAINAALEPIRLKHLPTQSTTCALPNRLQLVLLHDSFGMFFRDVLARDVSEMTAIGTYEFPREFLEAQRPQIVVQLFVERVLKTQSIACHP